MIDVFRFLGEENVFPFEVLVEFALFDEVLSHMVKFLESFLVKTGI